MPNTRRRRISGVGFRIYTYLSLLLILGPAAWLLISVVAHAAPHWKWSVLTQPLKGQTGGLRDQILGTLIIMAGVLVLAGDILSGFPSIVLGYVGYVALVIGLHWGLSLVPALIILSIMVVP